MATWEDLSNFTHGELSEMELTYGDLKTKTLDELMAIAKQKLDRFRALPDDTDIPREKLQEVVVYCQTYIVVNNPTITNNISTIQQGEKNIKPKLQECLEKIIEYLNTTLTLMGSWEAIVQLISLINRLL